MSKNHTDTVCYFTFCTTEYLVGITIANLNAWEADNLAPLGMLFQFITA